MLLLNEVFARTWAHLPAHAPAPAGEFWAEAISTVKRDFPDALFLAEAYWGLEPQLQSLGFDYAYDKIICDLLTARRYADLRRHLLTTPPHHRAARTHFLENHDERRIASVLSPAELRAAALLILGLSGMRLLYEGQLHGWRQQAPVHLGRWPDEQFNREIHATATSNCSPRSKVPPSGQGRTASAQTVHCRSKRNPPKRHHHSMAKVAVRIQPRSRQPRAAPQRMPCASDDQ